MTKIPGKFRFNSRYLADCSDDPEYCADRVNEKLEWIFDRIEFTIPYSNEILRKIYASEDQNDKDNN